MNAVKASGASPLAAKYFTATKVGQILSSGSNQYFPSLVDMRGHSTFPYDWALYTSTDHDSGAGGIYLWVANGDPTVAGNWKSYNAALAEGGFDSYGSKPAANPIFQDTTEGDQTETPCVVLIADVAYMTYHQDISPGTTVQKTMLATAADGLNFTRYTSHSGGTTACVLEPDTAIASGVHTGYFRWGANPFSGVAYDYVGYSLWYDTVNSHSAMWGSDDGISWTLLGIINKRRYYGGVFGDGSNQLLAGIDPRTVRPTGTGTYIALTSASEVGAGETPRQSRIYEIELAADGYTIVGDAREVLAQGTAGAFDEAGLTVLNLVDVDGQLVLLYDGDNNSGLDKLGIATVEFTSAATPISARPLDESYDTEYYQDFRGASALISEFAVRFSTSGTYAFSADGLTLSTASGTIRRALGLATAINPNDYEMIEFWVQGMTTNGGSFSLQLGDGPGHTNCDNGVYVTSTNSLNRIVVIRNRAAGASILAEDTASYTYVGATTKISWGLRVYPQLGIAQLLGHNRDQICYQWDLTGVTFDASSLAWVHADSTGTIRFEQLTVRLRGV